MFKPGGFGVVRAPACDAAAAAAAAVATAATAAATAAAAAAAAAASAADYAAPRAALSSAGVFFCARNGFLDKKVPTSVASVRSCDCLTVAVTTPLMCAGAAAWAGAHAVVRERLAGVEAGAAALSFQGRPALALCGLGLPVLGRQG